MYSLLYKLHRWAGLIVVLPMIAWCLSGLTHPLMAHVFKPIASKELPYRFPTIPNNYIPVQQVLKNKGIGIVDQIRLIEFEDKYYYQTQIIGKENILDAGEEAHPNPNVDVRYFAIESGEELVNGDISYAKYLARQFINEDKAPILGTERITQFNPYYASINRLIPVHQVEFDRNDGIGVYVDTLMSRLAYVSDTGRNICHWVFRMFHNWDFLGDRHSPLRVTLVLLLISVSLFSGLSGLVVYGFLWPRLKKMSPGAALRSNTSMKWHRRIGIIMSLSLIGFSTSGVHIATDKYKQQEFFAAELERKFDVNDLTVDPLPLMQTYEASAISLAKVGADVYWQLHSRDRTGIKEMSYISANIDSNEALSDEDYARYLVSEYSGRPVDEIVKTEYRTSFGRDYPVIFKRLPVHKVVFSKGGLEVYFVETQTGLLANRATKPDIFRTIHFLSLHKYHLFDRFGVFVRDMIMTAAALLVLLVSLFGLWIWLRNNSLTGLLFKSGGKATENIM